ASRADSKASRTLLRRSSSSINRFRYGLSAAPPTALRARCAFVSFAIFVVPLQIVVRGRRPQRYTRKGGGLSATARAHAEADRRLECLLDPIDVDELQLGPLV